jgi:hypothetical protein
MPARSFAFGVALSALVAAPALAEEPGAPSRAKETCAEVGFGSDSRLKIPCPPGIRSLLDRLPRVRGPETRRDIAIDPSWPHDKAIIAGLDWPYDRAMIAPHEEPEKPLVPLIDDLLKQFGPVLSSDPEGGSWGELQFGGKPD